MLPQALGRARGEVGAQQREIDFGAQGSFLETLNHLVQRRLRLPVHGGILAGLVSGHGCRALAAADLDVLEAEAALDAEVAARDVVVDGRGHLHDRVVLHVQRRACSRRRSRGRSCRSRVCSPRPTCPPARSSCSAREHQRAGRADARCSCRSRRRPSRAAATSNSVEMRASKPRPATAIAKVFWASLAAGLDALVAEDALRVVAHVEVVVDPCTAAAVARSPSARWPVGAPKRSGSRAVLARIQSRASAGRVVRQVDRRGEQLEHQLAASGARARSRSAPSCPASALREQAGASTRAPSTSTTQTRQALTGVERLDVAERRRVDPEPRGRRRGSSRPRDPHRLAVDLERRRTPRRGGAATRRRRRHDHRARHRARRRARACDRGLDRARRRSGRGRRSRRRASPAPSSASSASSVGARAVAAAVARAGASASSWRTVPTRQGTHWPHDSSRKNAAMRSRTSRQVDASRRRPARRRSRASAPAARVSSKVSGRSSSSGRTKPPAAPPSSTACSGRAARDAAGEVEQLAERRAERHLVDARAARRGPRRRTASCPVEPAVPIAA